MGSGKIFSKKTYSSVIALRWYSRGILLIALLYAFAGYGQEIQGRVYDITQKIPLQGVSVLSSSGYGTQTDTWTVGTGVAYTPNDNVELRLAGVLGILTSGESGAVTYQGVTYGDDVSYSFGNDLVAAISADFKVKF